ncbi:MAG TPA: Maf family protein [Roseiflexaceae bacterium]|jgi:septum formation protein|nr:Maf family protein [Roseiflexaceae bacterium]
MTAVSSALVLASGSPRRRELLGYLRPSFHIIVTDAEEKDRSLPPAGTMLPAVSLPQDSHPAMIAWRKARAACAEVVDSVIIGADTIVVLDGDVIGKPKSPDHARQLLRRLSGRTHTVYTGLAIIDQAAKEHVRYDVVASDVTLATLSDETISSYVATGEPLDKAGAYGIQGLGGRLVEQVTGSYTNVVGLPLPALHRLLTAVGVAEIADPFDAYQRWLADQGKEPLPCPPTLP